MFIVPFMLKAQIITSYDTTLYAKGVRAKSTLVSDGELYMTRYPNTDASLYLSLDASGRAVLRAIVVPPGISPSIDSTFFKVIIGNRVAYGQVNFNNNSYELKQIPSYIIRGDSGTSSTGKYYENYTIFSKGIFNVDRDSLFQSTIKNDAVFGFAARYNSVSGPAISHSAILNASGFEATKYKVADLNIAPSSATAIGTKGEIRYTATFIYLCIATNIWVRSPLSTF